MWSCYPRTDIPHHHAVFPVTDRVHADLKRLASRLNDPSIGHCHQLGEGAFHLTDDCGPLTTSSGIALASLRMASSVVKTFSATPSSRPPHLCLPPAFRQEGRRRERLPHSVGRSAGWPPAQRSSRRPCARRRPPASRHTPNFIEI